MCITMHHALPIWYWLTKVKGYLPQYANVMAQSPNHVELTVIGIHYYDMFVLQIGTL